MRKRALMILGLFVVLLESAGAQVRPGDTVRLVERDIHIPAHPAPGNQSVSLRFISGSTGTVLAVDPGTGWIQVRGKPLQGDQNTGWITERYVAERIAAGDVPTSGPLAWCPPKGSSDPHPSGRLRIATWNLGNLHSRDGESRFTGGDPSVKRFSVDYDRIRCYVRLFDPDIMAVQEVDGEAALRRVVDEDVYDVHVSDRPEGTLNGQQNTGFAFKRGLDVTKKPDFEALDVRGDGRLRYGTRIDLNHGAQTIRLMSVHLKSGCSQNGSSTSACNTLQDQVPVLEGWIDDAARGPVPFIVLGDFNRRFNQPGDLVWMDIDDGEPANADLTNVTENMPISCRDNQFTEFIDHILFDKRSIRWVDRSSFRHVTYRQADRDEWDKISDHCAVVIEMWFQ